MKDFKVLVTRGWEREIGDRWHEFTVHADRMTDDHAKGAAHSRVEFWVNEDGQPIPRLVAVFDDYIAAWRDGSVTTGDINPAEGFTVESAIAAVAEQDAGLLKSEEGE